FVAYLENRVGELERRLRGILPGINLNRELETLAQLPSLPPPRPAYTHLPPTTSSAESIPTPAAAPFQHVPTQDEPPVLHSAPELLKQVRQVSTPSFSAPNHASNLKNDMYWSATASTKAEEPRFHGTSSGEILLRDAKELRREYIPSAGSGKILRRRQQFWEPPAPEKRHRDAELEPVQLPPEDLVSSLVEVFFRRVNLLYPILHRGQFEHQLALGTHLASDTTGRTFARVLLLVCAVASRWSSDPRVFTDGDPFSAGYEFFRRIGPATWAVRAQPSIHDVQICILSALFLHGTPAHYTGWVILGMGIRLAQDVGAHRRKEKVTIENELYKRAFWTLLALDRMMCGALGRPSAMQDLDSDLDPIVELDDEDWPAHGDPFYPFGKASRLSYFNGLIGLSRILGRAIQTLYALDRTRRQIGLIGPEKEGELLADLQRHLEQWKKTVPPHLQVTSPTPAQGEFLDQTVSLWAAYYHIDIIIHREFITKRSVLTASCLDRCRRSARECARILEIQLRAEGSATLPEALQAAFSSGMVLVFDILAGETSSRDQDNPWAPTEDYPKSEKEADVDICRAILERSESRWYLAGHYQYVISPSLPLLAVVLTNRRSASDILKEFQRSGNNLVPSPEPGPALEEPSLDIHEPYAGGAGPLPGPGEPYPFSFSFNPHYGQNYASGQASGMVANVPPTSAPSMTTHGTFTSPYTTPPSPPPVVCPQNAYFPEGYYGNNTNIPFPGYVSQLNFAPNQGRDDESQRERQASYVLYPFQ
ncbi:hypothetical protein FRC11_005147, partial [Ceratobasidium sp. 423]